MKALLLASVASLITSSYGVAADAVVDDVVVVQYAYDWSGVFIGGAIGYQIIRSSDQYSLLQFGILSEDDGGFAGAIYGGYNYQHMNWVYGIEGDVKLSSAKPDDGAFQRLNEEVSGSIRGRIGYAFDNVMPYITGGLGIGRFEQDHRGYGNPDDFATETLAGYAVGGGVELSTSSNLIVRAEYIFTDYGTSDFSFYDGRDVHDVEVETYDFRIGLAYKF